MGMNRNSLKGNHRSFQLPRTGQSNPSMAEKRWFAARRRQRRPQFAQIHCRAYFPWQKMQDRRRIFDPGQNGISNKESDPTLALTFDQPSAEGTDWHEPLLACWADLKTKGPKKRVGIGFVFCLKWYPEKTYAHIGGSSFLGDPLFLCCVLSRATKRKKRSHVEESNLNEDRPIWCPFFCECLSSTLVCPSQFAAPSPKLRFADALIFHSGIYIYIYTWRSNRGSSGRVTMYIYIYIFAEGAWNVNVLGLFQLNSR